MAGRTQTSQFPQSRPIHFGPYTLMTCPNNPFRTASCLTEAQQCIVDNLWNHRNDKSYPDILRILAGHFAFLNSSNPMIASSSTVPKPLEFEPKSVSALEAQIKQLKVSLAEKDKAQKHKYVQAEKICTLTEKIFAEEKAQRESKWESFPEPIHPLKIQILSFVLADRMAEHLSLQECFRKICTRPVPQYDGLTFSIISHDNPQHPTKCFSYVSAVINLAKWEDRRILGLDLSVENLTRYGMLTTLCLFDKYYPEHRLFLPDRQLRYICDRLATGGRLMNGYLRLDTVSIPPSFNAQYPDDLRQEILITGVPISKPRIHYNWQDVTIVSEKHASILDQIVNFRAMRIAKIEGCSLGSVNRLIAESRNTKIFGTNVSPLNIYVPFQSLYQDDPDLVTYFSGTSVKMLLTIQGDFPIHAFDIDDTFEDNDDLDDEYGNISNAMDA